jgi:cytochrome c oxidase subunit 1
VHRWAYAYNMSSGAEDFIPQNAPVEAGGSEPSQEHA